MKRCALTAAKDEGWTVFDGPLDAEEAAHVIIASNSGDLLVLLGDKRSQVFLMPP